MKKNDPRSDAATEKLAVYRLKQVPRQRENLLLDVVIPDVVSAASGINCCTW